MAKAGKSLGLISPILAVGAAALILFGYGYESASCAESYGRQPAGSEECTYESGTVSMFQSVLDGGDPTLFY